MQAIAQAVFIRGEQLLLTQTEDIVGQWKELPSQTLEKAEPESTRETLYMCLVEVNEVVKKLHTFYPEMLKALDIVGLSWLTCYFSVNWRSGTVPVD